MYTYCYTTITIHFQNIFYLPILRPHTNPIIIQPDCPPETLDNYNFNLGSENFLGTDYSRVSISYYLVSVLCFKDHLCCTICQNIDNKYYFVNPFTHVWTYELYMAINGIIIIGVQICMIQLNFKNLYSWRKSSQNNKYKLIVNRIVFITLSYQGNRDRCFFMILYHRSQNGHDEVWKLQKKTC